MKLFKKKYRNCSDEDLMNYICQGASGAFDELYARYSEHLLYYFFRMLNGDREKAQDFLQDLFLKIVENPQRFQTGYRFKSWVFTIASNMCKNEYRYLNVRKNTSSNGEMDSIKGEGGQSGISPDTQIDQKAFHETLFRELGKLDPNHRGTFLMRFQQNLSVKEISEIMNCAEGTVKSRLYYTVRKLSGKLQAFNPQKFEV
jgi:RNA polymerase sigma-70 factor (ECF subfamily)